MSGDASMRHAIDETAQVHATAIIDVPVIIGAGARIWHFSHILARSEIGARTIIG